MLNFPTYVWSHGLAASLFALLVIWQLVRGPRSAGERTLLAAFAMTSLWAWLEAVEPTSVLTQLAEIVRNLVWVGLLYNLTSDAERHQRETGLTLVYGAVAAVLGLGIVTAILGSLDLPLSGGNDAVAATALLLHILAAAGGLILVHNFYGQVAPRSRSSIRYAMLALFGLWFYDLNTHTIAYLSGPLGEALHDWRGLAVAIVAPLFALGARSDEGWRVRLSRAATFQSLSLLAICAYFVVMAVLATILRTTGNDWTGGLVIAGLSALTVAAMVILPSPRARSWAKVKIAKHFFEHRYDYRVEWLRFTETLARDGEERGPLGQRIVRAFAEMLDAPGGCLLVRDDHAGLRFAADFEWAGATFDPPPAALDDDDDSAFWTAVESQAHILELSGFRDGWADSPGPGGSPPDWLAAIDQAWVAVPLLHDRQLTGLVILSAPDFLRPLDWEDFDLLRTAGRQAASSLAEAVSQDALSKAQRFEEFNRRFAFIMHDIKNLVSQLSLLSRNAERHADNEEFRADMVATLKASVGKMNDLLARLAPQAGGRKTNAEPIALDDVLSFAVAAKRGDHQVRLMGDRDRWAVADASGLEQAVGHLVQNAIEASPADQPVIVRIEGDDTEVAIHIIDHGTGMDSSFIRTRLFEPFASTKDNGFGIGAFEARSLILAMGGRLDVTSTKGKGSRFTIRLAPGAPQNLRKSA